MRHCRLLGALILIQTASMITVRAELPNTLTYPNFFGEGQTFDRPVHFMEFPERDSTWVVVENQGRVVIVRRESGAWVRSVFDSLHVTGANGTPGMSPFIQDGGLLGFAFHPDYQETGKWYAYYTTGGNPGAINMVEGTADSSRFKDSGSPKRHMLRLDKSILYHNGGSLKFGSDGYLYVPVGDGGYSGTIGGGDVDNLAQDPTSPFGKMLRIDVDAPDAFPGDTTRNYGYPGDNPFVDATDGTLPEIWASGLRSPWGWSFHPITNDIWLGDVGEFRWEKVSRVPKGGNLGWKVVQGPECYPPDTETCDTEGLVDPELVMPHTPAAAAWATNSVTGGVFYFGDTASPFHGSYFFGNYVTNSRIYAVKFDGNAPTDTLLTTSDFPRVVAFSTDSQGRIYAVSHATGNTTPNTGTIRLMRSPDMPYTDVPTPVEPRLAAERASARLSPADVLGNREKFRIFDLDGREVREIPKGTFIVIEKGGANPPSLMTRVR